MMYGTSSMGVTLLSPVPPPACRVLPQGVDAPACLLSSSSFLALLTMSTGVRFSSDTRVWLG